MKPYRRSVGILASLSLAEIALRILLPWPLQAIVDYVAGSQPIPALLAAYPRRHLLAGVVAAGLLIQLAHHLVLMFHTRIQAATAQHMIRDLRQDLFSHLQRLGLSQHARMPKGDSVYRLESDAPCLENLVFGGLFPFTFSLLTLVVMFAVVVNVDATLALVSMVIVPSVYVWLKFYTRRIAPSADRSRQMESQLTERLYESFGSIRLVKSFAREPFEQQRFAGAAGKAMEANIRLGRHEATFSVVIALLTIVGNALVLIVGGMAVLRGDLTPGTLLVVVTYLTFIYGPLSGIANTTGRIQRALSSARRVREVLSLTPESLEPAPLVPVRPIRGDVEFDDVVFAYEKDRPVIRHVSFVAGVGETVALVGPSGGGKSTLLSLLPRFYEVTGGRIRIDGIDIRDYDLRSLRENIAVVHQEPILLTGSVRDNLRYGNLQASDDAVRNAAKAANADDFIAALPAGYDTDLREAGTHLSGGQRQRLSIARAFVKDAPILVLDEPTAALDTISEVLVLEALKRLRSGRTTFVIAHRLSTIREADRILVLDQGRLVAAGTDEQLLQTCALYRQLCRQMRDMEGEVSRTETYHQAVYGSSVS
jgi:ABC-type multidrug transport system fused ATPase/permease subunit